MIDQKRDGAILFIKPREKRWNKSETYGETTKQRRETSSLKRV